MGIAKSTLLFEKQINFVGELFVCYTEIVATRSVAALARAN